MDELQEVYKKIQSKEDLDLFKQVHSKMLSLGVNVYFSVFPIYIRYTIKNKVIAILYFNKKNFLDLGLNISKNKISEQFVNASYMKYPGISYSIKISKKTDIKNIAID
jgi:hypothetical protein